MEAAIFVACCIIITQVIKIPLCLTRSCYRPGLCNTFRTFVKQNRPIYGVASSVGHIDRVFHSDSLNVFNLHKVTFASVKSKYTTGNWSDARRNNTRFNSSCEARCWNCCFELSHEHDESVVEEVNYFCDSCDRIQPVYSCYNYFRKMNCEEDFDLDLNKLTQTFKRLQWKLHPDKFSMRSKEEQQYSTMQSSEINKAYTTLAKPLPRALYLLELNGLTIEEGGSGVEPEFLLEVMEVNEDLAGAEDLEIVRQIDRANSVKLSALLKELSTAFSEKAYLRARKILLRFKYFANIDDKAKERLDTF